MPTLTDSKRCECCQDLFAQAGVRPFAHWTHFGCVFWFALNHDKPWYTQQKPPLCLSLGAPHHQFHSVQHVRLSPASMEPKYWELTAELSIRSGDQRMENRRCRYCWMAGFNRNIWVRGCHCYFARDRAWKRTVWHTWNAWHGLVWPSQPRHGTEKKEQHEGIKR